MRYSVPGVAALLVAGVQPAVAQLVDTRVDTTPGSGFVADGVISPNEYGPANAYSYTGGGAGFGGTLGAGRLFMDSNSTNLFLGFQAGNFLNDNVAIFINSRAGGFTDADMNDTADGGRNVSSNLCRDVNDVFPAGFLPDYTIIIGSFGIVTFELNAGNTPGHLNFLDFNGAFTGNDPNLAREYTLPLSTLSITGGLDFFVAYCSDSGFLSDETIPVQPFTGGGNPGFDGNGRDINWTNFDRFVIVPTPGAAGLLGLGALIAARRRRA